MTNFEKIKAMNIDEVAELFLNCNDYCYTAGDCKNCEQLTQIKQWLESEAE